MPWTPRAKRFLLSSGSPLTQAQKDKMKDELHADPSLGHAEKKKQPGRMRRAAERAEENG
jgi:hypothetical protein